MLRCVRAYAPGVVALVFFALGSPSCGRSLKDQCDASGLTGQQVLNDSPSPMTGSLTYEESGATTYTLTLSYDGGAITCNASTTQQGCLGTYTTPANTTVGVTVTLTTGDGAFTNAVGQGSLAQASDRSLTLNATFQNVSGAPVQPVCALHSSSVVYELSGIPLPSTSGFSGALSVQCSSTSGAIATLS